MIVTGNRESRRKADGYVVATLPEIRQATKRILEHKSTPNDKERRDPWARALGYDADKAVCRRCLQAFDEVTDEHLRRKHGMTPSRYSRRHPDATRNPAPLGDDEMTTAEWKDWANATRDEESEPADEDKDPKCGERA